MVRRDREPFAAALRGRAAIDRGFLLSGGRKGGESAMTDQKIPRRDFLRAVGTIGAATVAGSLGDTAAAGQTARPTAEPRMPAADTILKNAKVITVDAAFSIASAVAIAGG